MAYPLGRLLSVREYREHAAESEVQASKRRVTEAQDGVRAAEKALVDFLAWRDTEEDRLFGEIRRKKIAYRRLEDHLQDVRLLRAREAEFQLRIQEAEKVRRQRETELERARKLYSAATQAKRKIEEHRKIWRAAEVILEAVAEDHEMEEFTGKKADAGMEG